MTATLPRPTRTRQAPPHLPAHAYGGARSRDRSSTGGATKRHAVPYETHVAGHRRPDAECGTRVQVDLGEWDPTHPDNCTRCTTALRPEETP